MISKSLIRVRRSFCALLLALLAFSWGYFAYSAVRDWQSTQQDCHHLLASHALELEGHVRHLVRLVDILLQEISSHFSIYSESELLETQRSWLQTILGQVQGNVFDVASGATLFSTASHHLPVDFDPAALFNSGHAEELRIADNLLLGRDGKRRLAFYRQFLQKEQELLTVFFVDPEVFVDAQQFSHIASDSTMALYFNEGELLSNGPAGDGFGAVMLPGTLKGRLPEPRLGVLDIRLDDQLQILAYRKLTDLPLVITVSAAADAVFAEWQIRFYNFLLIQVMVSLAAVLALLALNRSLRRVERVELDLVEREEQFRAMADSSVDAVISADGSGRILFWSRGAENVFDCPGSEALKMPVTCFLQLADDERPLTLPQLAEYHVPWSRSHTFEVLGQRKNGELFPTELSVSHSTVAGQPQYTVIVRDVTERKQAEDRIRRMASHDNLTGLPNRTLLMDRLQVAMAQVRRQGGQFALLFVDLDKFKPVNDNFGHDIGDRLLQQVATRMLDKVRASDTVARIGGDEFALLLNNVDEEKVIEPTCSALLAALSREFNIGGNRLEISASIGAVFFTGQDQNPSDLIRRADNAMYAAKRAGRSCYRIAREKKHGYD